jgi:hypothetical protein
MRIVIAFVSAVLGLASAFAFVLFATAQANAAVVVLDELVNPGTVYPGGFVEPTSNLLADSTTGTVFQNVSGSVQDVRRSPFDNPAGNPTPASAANNYTAVLGGGSATFNVGSALGSVGLCLFGFFCPPLGVSFLWGSPDFYNKVEFFNGTTSLGFVTGADLTNASRNPPQDPATGQSWVYLLPIGPWTSVVFSSTTNAFEFTSLIGECAPPGAACSPSPLETLLATPLPAALILFATGLGALGLFGWRR